MILLLAAGAPAMVDAAPTAVFKVSTAEQLEKGEPKGTFVSSEGEVLIGRSSTRLKTQPTSLVWSTARDAKGTVYFGTGGEGILLAVRGNKVRRVAKLNALLVTALSPGPGGKLLAATMPGAKILEVNPKTGKWRQLSHLPAEHVWALLYDQRAGLIYAASGAPGKIYTVPARGGKPTEYYDSKEKHLLCLARAKDGALLAGSADKAILYRVTSKQKATAIADFDANELQDIEVSKDGTVYAAVNKFQIKTSGLPRFDRPEKGKGGTTVTVTKKKDAPPPKVRPQELRPGAKTGKGAVFRINPDGTQEQLLALDKGYFTDLAQDPQGMLWAADGVEGKVFLLRPDRTVLTAFDLEERQVLALAVDGKEQYMGTGDAGALYRVAAGPAAKAAFLSEVLDAQFIARWGTLRYLASGKLQVESRSGNSVKPDHTWAPWTRAPAMGQDRARLSSATSRYLQIKFTWPPPRKAVLRSFSAYYLPQNQRARITEITQDKAAAEKGKPREPKLSLKWKVDNPDKDPLVYRLYVRKELGRSWRIISGPDPLDKAEFSWNTEPVPDGYYRIKVVASDEQANGPRRTRPAFRISERLLVDNRKPMVAGLTVKALKVTGVARDSYSVIKRIEYSLDGKPWRLLDAVDGIYDSDTESFRFSLPKKLSRGPHVLAVRAIDEADNMGVTKVEFKR